MASGILLVLCLFMSGCWVVETESTKRWVACYESGQSKVGENCVPLATPAAEGEDGSARAAEQGSAPEARR